MATIQGVYVALFGRPADPIGLAFFNTATNNGADLTAIGDLASTQEYKDLVGTKNFAQVVNDIYQRLFDRDADADGLNFFVNALNNGTLNINNVAIAILDGAQTTDKTRADIKIAAANKFTAQIDTPLEIDAYKGNTAAGTARTWLDGVTTEQTDADVKAQVEAIAAGATITLTAGAANIANSAVAAPFQTTVFNDIIDGAVVDSWDNGDQIDGGVGTDTLNALLGTAVNVDGTTTILKSVEVLNLTADAAGVAVNLDKAEGVTTIWAKASANTDGLTLSNVAKTVALGVEGVNGAVTFGVKDVAGTADALTITLKGAATTGLTVDGIEALTLKAETASTTVAGITGTTLKDVVLTGTGGGTYTFAATTLKTVDASAINAAGVSIDVAAATGGVTVTGSKFAETITLNTTGALATDKDIVVYNKSNVSTYTQKDTITGFTTGEDKLDLKAFGLTGGKDAATTFAVEPLQGSDFLGNAVAVFNNTLFVDTNNNGVLDLATDFQVTITGGAATVAVGDIIFA